MYINYIFNKTTLIILGISIALMVGALIVISTPSMDKTVYLMNYKEIHNNYFRLGVFVIELFNSVIITTIVITVIINSISFDSLFISDNPRYIICISKLLAILAIMTVISLFEVFIIYLIPLIHYPLYKMELNDYMLLFYLLIIDFFEISISVLLTTIIGSIFIPMGVLFIFTVLKVITQSMVTLKKVLNVFIPMIDVSGGIVIFDGYLVGFIWIILLIFLYFSVYNIKDLKQI